MADQAALENVDLNQEENLNNGDNHDVQVLYWFLSSQDYCKVKIFVPAVLFFGVKLLSVR